MKTINLRDFYPFYETDCPMILSDEIADVLIDSARAEKSYQRKIYRHQAHYSLDRNDGIENNALLLSSSPEEIYERKETYERLYDAIASLPEKQAKRIVAYFFLGFSQFEIAELEGISKMAVCSSIARGLRSLEGQMKSFFA